MHYHIAADHRGLDAVRVADIAGKYFKVVKNVARRIVEPAPGIKGIIKDKGLYFVAPPHEFFCQMGANKPIGSGNEYFFVLQIHLIPGIDMFLLSA
jgi:hypothetical protein